MCLRVSACMYVLVHVGVSVCVCMCACGVCLCVLAFVSCSVGVRVLRAGKEPHLVWIHSVQRAYPFVHADP